MGGDGSIPALELEADTLRRVSGSISAIEAFLAEWEASKKSEKLERDTAFLRTSHGLLSEWGRECLVGRKDDESARKRLQKFAEICRKIGELKGDFDGI